MVLPEHWEMSYKFIEGRRWKFSPNFSNKNKPQDYN